MNHVVHAQISRGRSRRGRLLARGAALALAACVAAVVTASAGTAPRQPYDVPDAKGLYPDKPGTLQYKSRGALAQDGLPLPLARVYMARVDSLMSVLGAAPVFHPPLGVMVRAYSADEIEYRNHRPVLGPVHGSIGLTFYYFVEVKGEPAWGGESNSSFRLGINDSPPPVLEKHSLWYGGLHMADGREIFFEPERTGEIQGHPLWAGTSLVLTRDGLPPWVPVTREQYLTALIASRDSLHAETTAELSDAATRAPKDEWLAGRPERMKAIDVMYKQLRATSPRQADSMRTAMLKMESDMETELKAQVAVAPGANADEPLVRATDAMRAELAAMSPGERASQAWRGSADLGSGLMPAGSPDARPLAAANPALLDPHHAITDFQVICADADYDGSEVSNARVRELMEGADWSRVASFLRASARPRAR